MTLAQLADRLRGIDGPAWAQEFTSEELDAALRHARDDLKLSAYVSIPSAMRPKLVARAAVYLNHLDPARMATALDARRST